MNQRIKQLSKEAFKYALSQHPGSDEFQPIWTEKFAELIVRECSQFVEDKFDFCGDELIIAEQILKHFGVEE